MDYPNHITSHEKGKHLTYEDYVVIELRLKDGWKPDAIAKKELNCSANTVRNIIKKGMTPLYNGKVFRFKAKTAWKVYQENRCRSCRTYETLEKRPFLHSTWRNTFRRIGGRWMPVLDVRWKKGVMTEVKFCGSVKFCVQKPSITMWI